VKPRRSTIALIATIAYTLKDPADNVSRTSFVRMPILNTMANTGTVIASTAVLAESLWEMIPWLT
jgi:hypothetical protein